MSIKTLRVSKEIHQKIELLQKTNQYNFLYEVIEDMADFFIENGLKPSINLNLQIHKEIEKLSTNFSKRDDSFRKWFGEISNKKIMELLKQNEIIRHQNDEILKVLSDKFKDEILNEVKEFNSIKKDNEPIKEVIKDESLKLDKDVYYKILDEKDQEIKDLKNKINIIINKSEKAVGSKIFYTVKLNEMEYNTIKNI